MITVKLLHKVSAVPPRIDRKPFRQIVFTTHMQNAF